MALFKLRKKKVEEAKPAAAPAESVEAMRRRARHRLIGAVVLVLVGVIGFPLLFDTQPRPVAVDIPIQIPDRNKVKPLPLPATPGASAAAAGKITPEPVAAASQAKVAVADTQPAKPLAQPETKPAPAPEAKPEAKPQAQAKPESKPQPQADANAEDAAKARALLAGKTVDTAPNGARYVVQVGAFADVTRAREARMKVERAGLKTYTNVAETKDGRRIRVRAGPFSSRAEADRAAAKIKGLDLPAAILTL